MARTRYTSTSIFDLQVGDVILSNDNPEQEWTAETIERRGVKRITWRITWSNGRTHTYGSTTRFRVMSNTRSLPRRAGPTPARRGPIVKEILMAETTGSAERLVWSIADNAYVTLEYWNYINGR